jgi:hypothetical protein
MTQREKVFLPHPPVGAGGPMLRWMKVSLLVVGLTLCVEARAEDPRKEAALVLVKLVMPEAAYDDMIVQMSQQMTASMNGSGAHLPPDFAQKMPLVVREALPYADMVQVNADIYAKHFTVEEIRGLQEFYNTPLGKKLSSKTPDISAEAMGQVGALLPQRLPALMKKHGLLP